LSILKACQAEAEKLSQLGGTGGVIGLDKSDNIAMKFSTSGIFRGYIKSNEEKQVVKFKQKKPGHTPVFYLCIAICKELVYPAQPIRAGPFVFWHLLL